MTAHDDLRTLVLVAAAALSLPAAALAGVDADGVNELSNNFSNAVEVRTSLDRDAVWVADRFVYTIQLTCREGTDILPDDLRADKLNLDGPEIVAVDTTHEDRGSGVTVHRLSYHMITYRVDPAVQRIGDSMVRYYVRRPGQRLDDGTPAGEVLVPGRQVVVRSLLPDEREAAVFRDARPPIPRPARDAMLEPVGLGLLVLSIGPAVVWAAVAVGRRPARQRRRSVRHGPCAQRVSVESLRAIDPTGEEGRRSAYELMFTLVHQHLREVWTVGTDALTAAEIGALLAERGHSAEQANLAATVLAACERARYGDPGALGSVEDCRTAIDQAARFLGARERRRSGSQRGTSALRGTSS